jgi:hypothetical protein
MNVCSSEGESELIVRRLDAIIALLVLTTQKSLSEKIVALHNAGLRPTEIAEILGKKLSYITKELTLAYKKAEKAKERDKAE